MGQLLEWSPLAVFFIVFKLEGIYWATGALMVSCVLVLIVHRVLHGEFKPMHVITAGVLLVLGTATLLFHDARFIHLKPTVLLGLAAAVFLGSGIIGKEPLSRRLLESAFDAPLDVGPIAWQVINALWVCWLAALAAANLFVAANFAESAWVNFKVFGITVGMILFALPQVLWLSGKTKDVQAEGA